MSAFAALVALCTWSQDRHFGSVSTMTERVAESEGDGLSLAEAVLCRSCTRCDRLLNGDMQGLGLSGRCAVRPGWNDTNRRGRKI